MSALARLPTMSAPLSREGGIPKGGWTPRCHPRIPVGPISIKRRVRFSLFEIRILACGRHSCRPTCELKEKS
jgi:hypothetical protein